MSDKKTTPTAASKTAPTVASTVTSTTAPKTVRVAAAQFYVGSDVEANLAACLHWLDQASACQPDLVVLPEFCNHLSWYQDMQHCFDVSVALGGPFLGTIAERARALGIYVVVNCTVQREGGVATGSSLLYGPDGALLIDNTKQIYIGHENDFLRRATEPGPVLDTPLGRLGLYSCMDGVVPEVTRSLALNGAQVMVNSLNSFATDECSLHIPARAAENKSYVVAANKVGPLVPEDMVEAISAATSIPKKFLHGAGGSQVVAPSGEVLVKASSTREEFVFADIEPARADDKRRPDGTDVFANRRPQLYGPIASDSARQVLPKMAGQAALPAAVVQLDALADGVDGTADGADGHGAGAGLLAAASAALAEAVAAGAKLIALPPMIGAAIYPGTRPGTRPGTPTDAPAHPDTHTDTSTQTSTPTLNASNLQQAQGFGAEAVAMIAENCGAAVVGTALVLPDANGGHRYCAVLVDGSGIIHTQPQVHPSARHAFSAPADGFGSCETPWGRVAVVPSDDSIYPETFRLLALAGVEVALVPLSPLEDWELATGLLERSAENRINLLVAPDTTRHGPGFITALQTDFTVMTEWAERPFDGLLSQPEWHRCAPGATVLLQTVRPANAANKVVSQNTDLLANRPWALSQAIVR